MTQSLDAERAVLGSILIDPSCLSLIDIEPHHFLDTRHATIFQAIKDIRLSGGGIDLLTVSSRLESEKKLKSIGGRTYLAGITEEIPTSSHVEQYADTMKKLYLRREVGRVTRAIEEGGDMDELYDKLIKLRIESETTDEKNVFELVSEYDEEMKERKKRKEESGAIGIKTGFQQFDEMVCLLPKQLVVLAARPSVGKSALGSNLALGVAKHKGVSLFISLEMSHGELMDRMLSEVSQIDSEKFKQATVTAQELERSYAAMGIREGLVVWAPDSCTTTQIYAHAAKIKQKRGLDIVFVDYLGLLSDKRSKGDTRDIQIGNMTRALKIMAKQLDVCVVLLAQLNREAADDRVELNNLRESGNIEQDANTVLGLQRKKGESDASVVILKNRSGKLGYIPLKFHEKTSSFQPIDIQKNYQNMDIADVAEALFKQ